MFLRSLHRCRAALVAPETRPCLSRRAQCASRNQHIQSVARRQFSAATESPESRSESSHTRQQPQPILTRLRNDLKAAIKSRNQAASSTVRSLMADVSAQEKSSDDTPITPLQFHSILSKRTSAIDSAVAQFQSAGRQDLVEGEQRQKDVLDAYRRDVEKEAGGAVTELDVTNLLASIREQVVGQPVGKVLGKLLGKGAPLEGRIVDRQMVARVVQQAFGSGKK